MSDHVYSEESRPVPNTLVNFDAAPPRGPGRPAKVRPPAPDLNPERKSELADSMARIRAQLGSLSNSNLTASQRIERLLSLNFTLMLPLVGEALSEIPDMNRSAACARAMTALKDTVAIVAKHHELETTDAFNPRSPKFTLVLGWFIELVHRTLSQHTDETTVTNFFQDLCGELTGWEDRVERQLKGVAPKALAALPSPFTQDFLERVQAAERPRANAAG